MQSELYLQGWACSIYSFAEQASMRRAGIKHENIKFFNKFSPLLNRSAKGAFLFINRT